MGAAGAAVAGSAPAAIRPEAARRMTPRLERKRVRVIIARIYS
jgi:fructose-1-phosphate kinase PfkB-like protein